MRNILFSNSQIRLNNFIILLVRLSIGPAMLTHGLPKLMRFFSEEPLTFGNPIGIGMVPSLVLVVFAEVFCSIFISLGLFTRPASLVLIINMAVAAFIAHAGGGFGDRELAVLYLLIYLLLFATGGGRYSLDRLVKRRKL